AGAVSLDEQTREERGRVFRERITVERRGGIGYSWCSRHGSHPFRSSVSSPAEFIAQTVLRGAALGALFLFKPYPQSIANELRAPQEERTRGPPAREPWNPERESGERIPSPDRENVYLLPEPLAYPGPRDAPAPARPVVPSRSRRGPTADRRAAPN